MTNEKIKEILDRCNGRFGWVQIHIDTEENYLLMPLADLVELLEKQIPKKPIYSDYDDNGFGDVIPYTAKCPVCGYEFDFGTWNENHHCICGQALDWSEERGGLIKLMARHIRDLQSKVNNQAEQLTNLQGKKEGDAE